MRVKSGGSRGSINPALITTLTSLVLLHGRYFIFGLASGFALASLQPFRSAFNSVSLVTAYASIALLGVTLLFGPLRVLKGGRPIITTSTRRHLGVWSGVFAIAHVGAGLNVHMSGRYLDYFLATGGGGSMRLPRLDAFGAANDIGLIATLLVIVLMVISRDRWVRSIGPVQWKRLQRGAYWLTGLAFAHGFLYQLLEGRGAVPIFALFLILATIVGYQLAGRARWLLREGSRPSEP